MDDDKLTLDLLLDSLCAQDRDIIVLWYIEGYNLHEIAKIIRRKYKPKKALRMDHRKIGIRIHEILEKLRENVRINRNIARNGT